MTALTVSGVPAAVTQRPQPRVGCRSNETHTRVFRLAAVGHLAFAPRQPASEGVTEKDRVAEFGVSVLKSARGLGIGSKLFERAAIVCRNHDVDTLYMHCLSSNQVMIHIAKKAGMEIHRDYGEADAYLKLGPADPASVLQEALDEQFATLDYTLKANKRFATKWLGRLTGRKSTAISPTIVRTFTGWPGMNGQTRYANR